MSLQDYQSAKSLIEETDGDFEGPKPEALVASAEHALGLRFPPSYRRFLLELGCGDLNGLEIYGVINENFEGSSVPNGIWLTLNRRRSTGLDHAYVLIGDGGDGTYYAIDTQSVDETGENPVVRLSVDSAQAEPVASSFGAYLLEAVQSVV
jgi:antitoxin YobK